MKKLLFIALIGLTFLSCKKESVEPQYIYSSDSVYVYVDSNYIYSGDSVCFNLSPMKELSDEIKWDLYVNDEEVKLEEDVMYMTIPEGSTVLLNQYQKNTNSLISSKQLTVFGGDSLVFNSYNLGIYK